MLICANENLLCAKNSWKIDHYFGLLNIITLPKSTFNSNLPLGTLFSLPCTIWFSTQEVFSWQRRYELFPSQIIHFGKLKKSQFTGTCNNGIFVLSLPLTGYVWFGGAKLILNSTLLLRRERWVSRTASVTFPFHSPPNQPQEVSLQNMCN